MRMMDCGLLRTEEPEVLTPENLAASFHVAEEAGLRSMRDGGAEEALFRKYLLNLRRTLIESFGCKL
jgi:hypothetical protein